MLKVDHRGKSAPCLGVEVGGSDVEGAAKAGKVDSRLKGGL